MITITANPSGVTDLGRLGENIYRRIRFDISEYAAEYPGASYYLINQRPGDSEAYPVAVVENDGQSLYWMVGNADLSASGQGRCELIVMNGEMVAKSIIYLTAVHPALDGSGTVPSPWESWFEQFTALKEAAEAAAQSAAESAEQAAQYALRIYVDDSTLKIEHVNNNGGE